MIKAESLAVLDIGSSKIACFAAHQSSSGKMNILGIGHQVSHGVKAGIIVDIKLAESSILAAVHAAEKMAGAQIDKLVVNLTGSALSSHYITQEISLSGGEVNEHHIRQMTQKSSQHFKNSEREVVHVLPIAFTLDGTKGVTDPRGMFGQELSAEFHVVTTPVTSIKNLTHCLARCHVNVEGWVATPYASGLSCLTEDERMMGVTMLDMGGGHTSIAMFLGGNLVYTSSVALGGNHISKDIAQGLSTSLQYAERIKVLYGSVVATTPDEREVIDIPITDLEDERGFEEIGGMETNYISKAMLTSIIRPRMEEMLELVRRNIEKSPYLQQAGSRLVLTGGAAQIAGLKEMVGYMFGRTPRIAKPVAMDGMAESTKGPGFSTSTGMLIFASEKRREEQERARLAELDFSSGPMGRVVNWFKQNF